MILNAWLDHTKVWIKIGLEFDLFLDQDRARIWNFCFKVYLICTKFSSKNWCCSIFAPKKPQQEEFEQKSSVLIDFYEGAPGY